MNGWSRREFTRAAIAAATWFGTDGSPLTACARPQEAPSQVSARSPDRFHLVDPELRSALRSIPPLVLSPEVLAQLRKLPLAAPLPPPMPQPVSRLIPGGPSAPDVHLVIVDPSPGEKNRPVLLHTHGGGYVLANTSLYPFIQGIARDCHCVVVSVAYRLAPETRYPGSLDDIYTALKWVYSNAASLGVDRERIAVAGESAGGGQAAGLALRARDRAKIPILAQVLLYPMLDDRTGSTRPAPSSMGQFIWTAQCNRFGWTSLLGVPAGSRDVPPGSVPARVDNLAGLPSTWIGVGSIDLFADEDVTYGRRLMDAGVLTELSVYPGAYHAFDMLVPDAAVSQRFTESWKSYVRRAYAA